MANEQNFPPVVYKYRTWTDLNHQAMLRENELYLSSPADFNDPFDCRIPVNYLLLDTNEKINEYATGFVKREYEDIISKGMDPNRLLQNIIDGLTNDLERIQVESETREFQQMDIHYGVFSLSARWNSKLMWSHYADKHQGFCIGFHEPKLQEAKLFGRGGMVITNKNDDSYPEIDPRDPDVLHKATLQTHYKSWDWDYEKEYRLTRLFFGMVPTSDDRKCRVSDDFIAELIIGIKTPTNHKNEMIEIAARKNIPVFQAIQVPRRFRIEKEQIA